MRRPECTRRQRERTARRHSRSARGGRPARDGALRRARSRLVDPGPDRAHLPLARARAGEPARRGVDARGGHVDEAGCRGQPARQARPGRLGRAGRAGSAAGFAPRHGARRRTLRRHRRRAHGARGGAFAADADRRRRMALAAAVRPRGHRVLRRGGHPLRQGAARLVGRRRSLGRRLVDPGGCRGHHGSRGLPRLRPRPWSARRGGAAPGRSSSATSRRTSNRARSSTAAASRSR